MPKAVRWGDNDRYFGPLTWSYSKDCQHWAIVLSSRGEEAGACSLRVSLGRATLIVALPNIIRPHITKVQAKFWNEETIKRLGRDWYWQIDRRQYGASLRDGHLILYLGRVGGPCMDSSVQQQWSCFLPWVEWRLVRRSFYDLSGACVHSDTGYSSSSSTSLEGWRSQWERLQVVRDACPTASFLIEDFDGERIVTTTRVEECEWRRGVGRFKWLSWFSRPKVRRDLDIRFSSEVGRDKGSWKGGVIGCGIEMMPGEDHEAALRRYCGVEHRSKSGRYKVSFIAPVRIEGGEDVL